ncbi:MAG: 9-O-acetylesterase [Bacteroidales bacterium]|nr:9-O-acetylesterase [Bacteroidales bacterium]
MKNIARILLILNLLSPINLFANKLALPPIFGSGMVLQRNSDVAIWGTATPGATVEIKTGWGEEIEATSDTNGKWMAKLKTADAGGPYVIKLTCGEEMLSLENILLGEVWLCSGQSNMEMPLEGWPPADTIMNSAKEIATANFPDIRLFTVLKNVSPMPLDSCHGEWTICDSKTVAGFSATAYFFGKELYEKLHVPIGLIHSSWGGTPAEAWIPGSHLQNIPAYKSVTDSIHHAESQYKDFLKWMNQLEHYYLLGTDPDYYVRLDKKEGVYAAEGLDDSDWKIMELPSLWEAVGLPAFDGVTWFRKTFTIPEDMAGKEMTLLLGPVDDMDISYINGTEVGQTLQSGKWKANREYTIPAGVLRAGENTVAVCAIDIVGGGGIYGTDPIAITDQNGFVLNLNGAWKYQPIAQIVGDNIYLFDEEHDFDDRPHMGMIFGAGSPTALYNAMINPIVPYGIRGAIWYQGESNVGRGFEYRTLFPTLIDAWRKVWNIGDFPFYFVQIAPWEYSEKEASPAAEVREAQFMSLSVPNTGMAVTMDIGNPANIHPANKEDVGQRLARWALNKDYHFEDVVYSGPLYKSFEIKGSKAIVSFDHTGGGLMMKGKALTHFEIAGSNQVYYPAEARISGNVIEVWNEKVSNPVAVRYGWSATAEPNLFNAEGLPASPFRTDDWKRLSE